MTVFYVCILVQATYLRPYNAQVVNGPLRLLPYPFAWSSQIIYILLYGQCIIAVTMCFVYRYQKANATFPDERFNWRLMAGLIVFCKLPVQEGVIALSSKTLNKRVLSSQYRQM